MITVIKRNNNKVPFDKNKIKIAIEKAYFDVFNNKNYPNYVNTIPDDIEYSINQLEEKTITVEDIQDMVEDSLMEEDRVVAKAYIRYRYKREIVRNTTDNTIFELLHGTSDYWNNENSNKNAKRTTVQRDYMAGIVSTDITRRFLLDKDIVEAHDAGIIHFHDADYFAQNALHNCELINLEDMLQNGTVVNDILIEKPKRLLTATTIATQIIAAVTSSSYGGATITLTHLAPFVRSSFLRYYKDGVNLFYNTDAEIEATGCPVDNPTYTMSYPKAYEYAMKMTRKEVTDSVQTFNYQTNSMTNTNGQAPFLSVCMYMNETQDYKVELAMLIEEFLKQRIEGMKNQKGVYITPAFPKLLYVLEEDNVYQDSKYWYLTELAAKCTAKRLVPDYISEKKMLEYKVDKNGNGQCYPCMGGCKLQLM